MYIFTKHLPPSIRWKIYSYCEQNGIKFIKKREVCYLVVCTVHHRVIVAGDSPCCGDLKCHGECSGATGKMLYDGEYECYYEEECSYKRVKCKSQRIILPDVSVLPMEVMMLLPENLQYILS